MKPEIKKQIILHLPYLAFAYLFGKVGQAFRLAQGADISAKLLHIGQGFSAAFASAAPSFHPTDLLIGLAEKPCFAAARAADDKNILVSCVLRVFGAVGHHQPFRLRQQHIVVKDGINERLDVCRCAP